MDCRVMNGLIRAPALVIMLVFLVACGGGGGTLGTSENTEVAETEPLQGCEVISQNFSRRVISAGFASNPDISSNVVDGQARVYVVWEGLGDIGNPGIFLARSTDGGANFSAPVKVGDPNYFSLSSPAVATSENHVYVVWLDPSDEEATLGNTLIRFTVSGDQGQNFSAPVTISDPVVSMRDPAVTAAGGSVYVSGLNLGDAQGDSPDQFLFRSADQGQTFDPVSVNVSGTGSAALVPAALAAEGDLVTMAWEDVGAIPPSTSQVNEIGLAISQDGGQNFETPLLNLSDNLSSSRTPDLALTAGVLHVIWLDTSENHTPVIARRRSDDQGQTFVPDLAEDPIGLDVTATEKPKVAAEGEQVAIAYHDSDPVNEMRQVFFVESDDAGQSFSSPVNLSENASSAQNPDISMANGQALVVWEGQCQTTENYPQKRIFFARP